MMEYYFILLVNIFVPTLFTFLFLNYIFGEYLVECDDINETPMYAKDVKINLTINGCYLVMMMYISYEFIPFFITSH